MPGFLDLGFARVDVDRLQRRGFPEAALGEGKSPDDLTQILGALVEKNGVALATRAGPHQYEKVVPALTDGPFEFAAPCIGIERTQFARVGGKGPGVSAGTTDRPV